MIMTRYKLFDFAYFLNFEDTLSKVAALAMHEQWGLKNQILYNYIHHTFSRLHEESKISFSSDNSCCCFNTGLLTKHYDQFIYLLFTKNDQYEKNKDTDKKISQWFINGVCKESDPYLGEYCDGKFPEKADFFQEPSKLIYNPKKKITVNYEHIIEHNKDRFSQSLQNKTKDEIKTHLDGVIQKIGKRVSVNYKIAVPAYYKSNIQLLLPLYLTSGSPNPDLALAITEQTHHYTAQTCLTMDMAYNNARLIVKPESDWLKPQF